jgi:rhodanese-related sulfurtransferase
MPPEALIAALETATAPRVLDVRTTREYVAGHVPGAIHVPYHVLLLRRSDLPAGKTDPVVVYCSHGPRAGMARLQLWTLGYQDVRSLDGQMSGWKRRDLPLNTGKDP